jgi:hypothetical protein
LLILLAGAAAPAQPLSAPYPAQPETAATAAAALSGWYATASTADDSIQIRAIDQTLIATIDRSQIAALLPWMDLTPSPDGPCALAFSDSGRLLFIAVQDAAPAPDGQPSDAILCYDTGTGQLSLFARLELFADDTQFPHLAAAHFKGRLYVGSSGSGGPGRVSVYSAAANTTTGTLLGSYPLPSGFTVHGLAIDRLNGLLYAATDSAMYRAPLASLPLSFTAVGSLPGGDIRALAYGDHYGATFTAGLYILESAPGSPSTLAYVPPVQAQGAQTFAPSTYAAVPQELHSLSATADGTLLAGAAAGALLISEQSDNHLSYPAFLADEFNQLIIFSRGLISPDGEPPGWVIDADTAPGAARFHPATPDGAAWAILALLMADRINQDPAALPAIRSILTRYAGLAPDGIAPSKTADGILRHWIDPATGQVRPGWDPEFATLSTALLSAAAAKARAYFPNDAIVQQAASRLVCQVRNHDGYVQPGTNSTYFKGLPGGGPDPTSGTQCFNESILWVGQLAFYGGPTSASAFTAWLNRSLWPTATFLTGRPITGDVAGAFQPAFTSLYPMLLTPAFRGSAAWQQQVANIRASNNAWTDDHGPRFNTVFSAGTTRPDWGGYHADTLGDHPGDVTTFPSLLALCASPASAVYPNPAAESVGAYNAYRRGGRQAFSTGASILYRRSDADPAYRPDTAGLPDVVLGAMGLAELLSPGSVDAALGAGYAPCNTCYANCDASTGAPVLNVNDFICFQNRFAAGDPYANCDGSTVAPALNVNDFVCFQARFAAGCP